MKQWFKEKPNERRIEKYAVFRTQVDKLTSNMCPEFTKVDQRKQKGAELYRATNVTEGAMAEEGAVSKTEEIGAKPNI